MDCLANPPPHVGGYRTRKHAAAFDLLRAPGVGAILRWPHFRRVAQAHGPLRLAILPIGAYEPRWFMKDQHMNPSDAVKALADCGAAQALAHHHGTFQLTDEAIDAPVDALHAALDEGKIPREKFVALKPGQVYEV